MPDSSRATPAAFNCEGGLVLNKSTFLMKAGEALELENFEPDISGGYRRINGFAKHITPIVPQTSVTSEKVSMVAFFNNKIMAARGEKIFTSAQTETFVKISAQISMSGSGTITVDDTSGFSTSGTLYINDEIFTYTGKTSTTFTGVTRATSSTTAAEHLANSNVSEDWTAIDTGRTSADKYALERFNFDGNDKIILVDRVNAPVVFNTSFAATDVSESSVSGAKHVVAYKGHMFYSGMSSTPQEIVFSQPFDEDAFSSGSGAGSIKVDDIITGLKTFRDTMYIFCENRIFSLTGTSSANFAVTPVTRDIGCINGDSIQEFAGDLIFLGPDGLRTVAGTARIGDVELGTISTNVQSIFDANIIDSELFDSIVIPDKTQYRIFFCKDGTSQGSTQGIICVKKGQGFEFSKIRGIKPASTDTFIKAGNVKVLHGSFDGYVYTQEKGNTFDGTAIFGKYRSPDLTFDDTGIRKHMQRVIVNYKPEAGIDADLFVKYDYEESEASRPAAYPLDSTDVVAIYGTSKYGEPTYGGVSQPLVRQAVEGSGFAVALRVNDGGETSPYSLKGFQLEYQTGARR